MVVSCLCHIQILFRTSHPSKKTYLIILSNLYLLCNFYYSEPSPPRNLQVVEVCADYICVTWQAPVSDGNSPITSYVVEKADASTRTFTIAGQTDSDTLEFKVSQLNKGKQYLIRVFAENVVGQSKPVSLQEPVRLPLGECVMYLLCFVVNIYACTHVCVVTVMCRYVYICLMHILLVYQNTNYGKHIVKHN